MPEISINNGNFLWMTRGKKWGFRYLSECSFLSPVAETVYKTVFLRDESRFGYWKGFVSIGGHKQPYVACRCYDSTIQRDEAGRRIPHDLLVLCSEEEYSLLNGLAWESLILDQVRGLYAERYPCPANEVTDCLIDFRIHLDSGTKSNGKCISLDIAIPTPGNTHFTPRRISSVFWIFVFFAFLWAGYFFMHRKTMEKATANRTPHADIEEPAGTIPIPDKQHCRSDGERALPGTD